MALVLASKSPRRRELMGLVTAFFEVDEALVDEAVLSALAPPQLAAGLARLKAGEVFARRCKDVVVGCDTVVEAAGQTLGKPRDEADAVTMLNALSGNRHLVHTGVCILLPGRPDAPHCFTETTAVDFAPLPQQAVAAYVRTAEPYDKAGGYGIQGWAARYVTRIEGCYYNVMGLPVARLYAALAGLGVLGADDTGPKAMG